MGVFFGIFPLDPNDPKFDSKAHQAALSEHFIKRYQEIYDNNRAWFTQNLKQYPLDLSGLPTFISCVCGFNSPEWVLTDPARVPTDQLAAYFLYGIYLNEKWEFWVYHLHSFPSQHINLHLDEAKTFIRNCIENTQDRLEEEGISFYPEGNTDEQNKARDQRLLQDYVKYLLSHLVRYHTEMNVSVMLSMDPADLDEYFPEQIAQDVRRHSHFPSTHTGWLHKPQTP